MQKDLEGSPAKTQQVAATAIDFPAGIPKPDQSRAWLRAMDTAIVDKDLTDVKRGDIPRGRFKKMWSKRSCQDPSELPEGHSYSDMLRHSERPCARRGAPVGERAHEGANGGLCSQGQQRALRPRHRHDDPHQSRHERRALRALPCTRRLLRWPLGVSLHRRVPQGGAQNQSV